MLTQAEGEALGAEFLTFLGCDTIDEARKLTVEELVERERSFIEDIRPGLTFSPIVDGWSRHTSMPIFPI